MWVENGVKLHIAASVFESNQAASQHGGALRILRDSIVVIEDSTFASNTAKQHGGAIFQSVQQQRNGAFFLL